VSESPGAASQQRTYEIQLSPAEGTAVDTLCALYAISQGAALRLLLHEALERHEDTPQTLTRAVRRRLAGAIELVARELAGGTE